MSNFCSEYQKLQTRANEISLLLRQFPTTLPSHPNFGLMVEMIEACGKIMDNRPLEFVSPFQQIVVPDTEPETLTVSYANHIGIKQTPPKVVAQKSVKVKFGFYPHETAAGWQTAIVPQLGQIVFAEELAIVNENIYTDLFWPPNKRKGGNFAGFPTGKYKLSPKFWQPLCVRNLPAFLDRGEKCDKLVLELAVFTKAAILAEIDEEYPNVPRTNLRINFGKGDRNNELFLEGDWICEKYEGFGTGACRVAIDRDIMELPTNIFASQHLEEIVAKQKEEPKDIAKMKYFYAWLLFQLKVKFDN